MDYKQFFKNKKITVMGLGLLGRGVGDAAFLAECGAKLTVTDLKSSAELKPSLQKLQKYRNIKYVLGKHRLEDFKNADLILKAAGVPLDSPHIKHARKNGIPVEMDESLFAKLVKKLNLNVKIIGVTGTRGKSTTTVLIYEILKASGMPVHLGGNIKDTATLPLLKVVKSGDTVVFELSSWQLQGFAEAKISPHISVFTNFMPDHMNYYENNLKKYFTDKSYIYKFHKKPARNASHSDAGGGNVLVLGPSMKGKVKNATSKIINANIKNIPKYWKINLQGKHNLENIACAVEVARVLEIPENIIKGVVENFKTIPGRLELVKNLRGVKIYNDTNSCTPEATSVALKTLGETTLQRRARNIILIMGGTDKNLELKNLIKDIEKYAKRVVLLPGNGTERFLSEKLKVKSYKAMDLKEAVKESLGLASRRGDTILFSPAFTSFGMFQNEYDRGDKFMQIVKSLK